MIQIKGQFSEDSFIIALSKYAVLHHTHLKGILTKKCQEVYDLICQFILLVTQRKSRDMFFTIMLNPTELVKANSDQFSFYLKLRKYIYTNFVNVRETKVKPLNFDQWVSIVSKSMDNSAIGLIGNRIREEAIEKLKDKNLKNKQITIINSIIMQDLLTYLYIVMNYNLKTCNINHNKDNQLDFYINNIGMNKYHKHKQFNQYNNQKYNKNKGISRTK